VTDQSLDSLIDLVKLTRRYSGADWAHLATILENEESRKGLIDAARALSVTASNQTIVKREPRSHNDVNRAPVLKALEKNDPEKARILREFRDAVGKGRILHSINQIRDFASSWGLKLPERTSRERVLNELVRFMTTLPKNEIEIRLRNIPPNRDFGRDYDNWVRIIMGESGKPTV
jgi:hypothetical protein